MLKVNICKVDRLQLAIRIMLSISRYINVKLLYLIRNKIFMKYNSGELGTPQGRIDNMVTG